MAPRGPSGLGVGGTRGMAPRGPGGWGARGTRGMAPRGPGGRGFGEIALIGFCDDDQMGEFVDLYNH
ncbi:hypothetical protein H5410_057715 [Solanum commersonii]|uniref:Uncharacterized protein n=1 Tax=Solanum commersonii TaxID=4109 RepID=A0A9J5WQI8_SOLCO|nr:hypothetical protein H5410_057715 [Solanum commersonii]